MNRFQNALFEPLVGFVNHHERLLAIGRDSGRHQATAYGQLI